VQLIPLLSAARARIPWYVASKILEDCGIPRGRGWDNTIQKLEDGFEPSEAQLEALLTRYKEHLVCGEKSVRFYDLDQDSMNSLRAYLHDSENEENALSSSYPLPLAQEQIAALPLSRPKLVGVERMEDGIAGIFCSIRSAELRVPLDRDDVPQDAQHLFDNFSEVVGVKTLKTQAFDVVWVPHEGTRADVRIDFPVGMTLDASTAAHAGVNGEIAAVLGQRSFDGAVNLFPLIDRIYRTSDEGMVVELEFATTTASIKREKMRRQHLSLRTELYHRGGTEAINGEIEPFSIGVEWTGPTRGVRRSYPELFLHSTSRMLHSPHPTLFDAIIHKCTGVHDFEFVRSRIETHLRVREGDGTA
jgi:hypothetical protein